VSSSSDISGNQNAAIGDMPVLGYQNKNTNRIELSVKFSHWNAKNFITNTAVGFYDFFLNVGGQNQNHVTQFSGKFRKVQGKNKICSLLSENSVLVSLTQFSGKVRKKQN